MSRQSRASRLWRFPLFLERKRENDETAPRAGPRLLPHVREGLFGPVLLAEICVQIPVVQLKPQQPRRRARVRGARHGGADTGSEPDAGAGSGSGSGSGGERGPGASTELGFGPASETRAPPGRGGGRGRRRAARLRGRGAPGHRRAPLGRRLRRGAPAEAGPSARPFFLRRARQHNLPFLLGWRTGTSAGAGRARGRAERCASDPYRAGEKSASGLYCRARRRPICTTGARRRPICTTGRGRAEHLAAVVHEELPLDLAIVALEIQRPPRRRPARPNLARARTSQHQIKSNITCHSMRLGNGVHAATCVGAVAPAHLALLARDESERREALSSRPFPKVNSGVRTAGKVDGVWGKPCPPPPRARARAAGVGGGGGGAPPPPPPPRTKWTRRVPHPVLIGHAVSLTGGARGVPR